MQLKQLCLALASVVSLGFAASANAGSIPYATPGTQNAATYHFTAASTGDVTAYFFGSTAGYSNVLTLLINGVETGVVGLHNHASAYGQALVLGTANAGDELVFKMINVSPGGIGPWYSDTSMNIDGVNHVYATDFAGNSLIPAGTFVGFEDLPGGGDFNYNDETFVFTNVAADVPEPASLVLAGLGLGIAGLRRRRKQA